MAIVIEPEGRGTLVRQRGNVGLHFQKHFPWRIGEKAKHGDPKEAPSLLQPWVEYLRGQPYGPHLTIPRVQIGDANALERAAARRRALVAGLDPTGRTARCRSVARLLPGAGNPHPSDVGMTWHATLGCPYVPGSSVKGAIRSVAAADEKLGQGWVERMLGPATSDEQLARGELVVFDAIPIAPVWLEIDILNPHYVPYYEAGFPPPGKDEDPLQLIAGLAAGTRLLKAPEAPADWFSPRPVDFLTVGAGALLEFALALVPGHYEPGFVKRNLDIATGLLDRALRELGIGAKTEVGYGRFEPA